MFLGISEANPPIERRLKISRGLFLWVGDTQAGLEGAVSMTISVKSAVHGFRLEPDDEETA